MSTIGNRLTTTVESHPRLAGALLTILTLVTAGVSTVTAGSGATVGP